MPTPLGTGGPPTDNPPRHDEVLARGMTAWIHLFGALNFEMFSRLDGVIDDRDAFFDHQMRVVARMLGITEARR